MSPVIKFLGRTLLQIGGGSNCCDFQSQEFLKVILFIVILGNLIAMFCHNVQKEK